MLFLLSWIFGKIEYIIFLTTMGVIIGMIDLKVSPTKAKS